MGDRSGAQHGLGCSANLSTRPLSDNALVAHDLILGRFDPAERARLYSDSQLFAAMFGIAAHLLPADYPGLSAYVLSTGLRSGLEGGR